MCLINLAAESITNMLMNLFDSSDYQTYHLVSANETKKNDESCFQKPFFSYVNPLYPPKITDKL